MGTENTSHTNSFTPPVSTPFATPSSSSRPPPFGSMPYSFRPTPPEAPLTTSAPFASSERGTILSATPDPPRPSSAFPSPAPWLSHGNPPRIPEASIRNPQIGPPSRLPAIGSILPPYAQVQTPTRPVSKESPPKIVNFEPPYATTTQPPQLGPSYTPRGSSVPPILPGYPSKQPYPAPQYLNTQPPLVKQGNYMPSPGLTPFPPPQGVQIPPVSRPSSIGPYSRGFAESASTDFTNIQGLAEDFSSLTLEAVPGSVNAYLDTEALPRPLDDDMEPSFINQMFPMNCHSRYFSLTTSGMPNSQSLLSRWQLPLGAIVCPLAEAPEGEEVPILNFASIGIIRCRRCRTYINPYVIFTDNGTKWRCNICSFLNDVPGDYFAALGADGMRVDLEQRPELTKGSIEFIAPTEYMVRPPMPPLYFFLIDVSISAVKSGMVESVAQTIKSCLDDLPGFPRTQIGFITYDSTVHFYNMKSSLTQPQMIVVSDLDDIFLPLPDDLLVNLSDSRCVVDTFLDSLPSMFKDNENLESAFGPALRAAFMVMNPLGGKLLIFQNTLPSLGVGRLRLRGDDVRVYGTDKEHTLRIPEDLFYKQMAADFTKFQIAVNVYAFSDKYTDIASLGTLAKYTGGQVYYYPGFRVSIHGEKLRHELARDLTRETAWEAVMRIRCGKGVRFTTYHGHFMLRSTDLLALPAVDCDKAFAMQLSLEETLLTTQITYFQVALLYTSSAGERRIRVHTAAASVVTDLGEMYRQADTGAIVSLLSRLAIEKTLTHKLEDARNSVQLRIVKALREYRNLYAVQHRLGGRMIYPEALKFLPLYGLALYKSIPLRGGYTDAHLDERCSTGYTMMVLPVKQMLKLLYPGLIRIDENLSTLSIGSKLNYIVKRLPLTADSLNSNGLYVYDNGMHFILWFGRTVPPDLVMNVLGVDIAVDLSKIVLREHDNPMSKKLLKILDKLRDENPSYYQVSHIVRQGDQPREGLLLLANLVEEQAVGSNGYADWMLQLHRQVLQNA